MAIQRTTPPVAEPVTLAQAKVHLKEDLVDTDNDAYITGLIAAARQDCEGRIGRTLITSGWTLTLDAFPACIALPMPNALAVASVSYVDTYGAAQVLPNTDYLVDVKSQPGRIVPAYGLTWPATRAQINAVTVAYTAGYGPAASDVPAPLKQWILLALGDMYERRTRSNDSRYPAVPQSFADGLLDAYKIWGM